MTAFTDYSWQQYLTYLSSKEGTMTNVIKHLLDKLEIYEKSISQLKKEFPIYEIIMLVYNEKFCPNKSINEKMIFLQKNMEILFNYARNLLIKFSIYRNKNIKVDTSRFTDYLSKFPNYSSYLLLMGYNYHKITEEWKISEDTLTSEKQSVLLSFTANCCLGYDYWNNCLKYLSLTVFTGHRFSIEELLIEKKCEYCEFDLDRDQYCCAVCETSIDKMPFFEDWKINNFTRSLTLNTINDHLESKGIKFSSLNHKFSKSLLFPTNIKDMELPNDEKWTCDCGYNNPLNQLNCLACYKENANTIINYNVDQIPIVNRALLDININQNIGRNHMDIDTDIKTNDLNFNANDNYWICSFCSAKNTDSLQNCHLCLKDRINDRESKTRQFIHDENRGNRYIPPNDKEVDKTDVRNGNNVYLVNNQESFSNKQDDNEIFNEKASDKACLLENHKTKHTGKGVRLELGDVKNEEKSDGFFDFVIKFIMAFFRLFH